jgi:two-component system OmpR family sensor kinase
MPRLSLRGLFSLLYLGSVLPLLLLLGGLVYYEYRAFLIYEHTTTMQNLVQATVLPRALDDADQVALPLPRLGDLLVEQMENTDFAVIVLDAEGQPLAQSSGAQAWLSAAQQATTDQLAAQTQTVDTSAGTRVLYLLAVRNPAGQTAGTIAASFPTSVVWTELRTLAFWLLLTVSGVALLALLVTPLLARLANRPLQGLVSTARQVSAGNLETRTPLPPVSELHTLATTLNTMLDQVQQTVQLEQQTAAALRRFVADAAHELRSPLAVLRGSIEVWQIAQQRGDQVETQQAAGLIQAEIEGMGRLVEDLLLLARMEHTTGQTQPPLQRAEVEPLPLLEEVAERARLLAAGQEVQLVWPEDVLESIMADADLLKRALNNLLQNALRHTPAGRRVTLAVKPEHAGCAFLVQDEGSGIAPEHLPHLFERFYQVDDARTRRRGSSGLGLAIVQTIAQAHGGAVRIASIPGQGTSVTLWIPCREQPGQMHQTSPPGRPVRQPIQTGPTIPPPRPAPAHRGWLTGVSIAASGLLLTLLVSSGLALLPTVADRTPSDSVAVVVVAETPTPTRATTAPIATAPTIPLPTVTAPQSTAIPELPDGLGFDAAAAQATQHLGGGIPLEVTHLSEEGALIYEIAFSDQSEVYLDLGRGSVLEVERAAADHRRGAEQRQINAARIASAVAQGRVLRSFDEAAAAAQAIAPDYGNAREVELEWWDEQARVVYSVEFASGPELLLDPQTSALLAWEE